MEGSQTFPRGHQRVGTAVVMESWKLIEGHYPWPFDGNLTASNTGLLIIDMQVAHCESMAAIVARTSAVLNSARRSGMHLLFTRLGHRPELSDLSATERWRLERRQSHPLVRGRPDWEIVPELAARPGEPVVDKPAMSAFHATDLDQILRRNGIRNLIFAGLFTDGSVQATLRDANDRGYEALLLEDCCAAPEPENHRATVRMLRLLCGLYGSVTRSEKLLEALS